MAMDQLHEHGATAAQHLVQTKDRMKRRTAGNHRAHNMHHWQSEQGREENKEENSEGNIFGKLPEEGDEEKTPASGSPLTIENGSLFLIGPIAELTL